MRSPRCLLALAVVFALGCDRGSSTSTSSDEGDKSSGDRETASVDVKMEWQYPPQKSWGTIDGQKVIHAHVATVEIVIGSDGKWTSYGEPGLKRDEYLVIAPDGTLGAWTTPGETDTYLRKVK